VSFTGRLEPLEGRALLSGTWTALTNPMPAYTPDGTETMILLSDGTVMFQGGGGGDLGSDGRQWYYLDRQSGSSVMPGN
jgi:hypothetical protein